MITAEVTKVVNFFLIFGFL